jgi:hypothetical protein
MTIQVGMVGIDGIVLAGDTRISRGPSRGVSASRMAYDGPKIRISDSGRIAVTCAHDMQTANNIADAIFANMIGGGHSTCEREIKEVCAARAQGRDVECIIVFADPCPCLYLFQHYTSPTCTHTQSQRITGCIATGDMQNPAVFWGMSYYQLLPVNRLEHLAACMVVAAGGLNSSMIGGFELVLCDRDGCRRLSNESAGELQSSAKEKIARIGEFILDLSDLTAK